MVKVKGDKLHTMRTRAVAPDATIVLRDLIIEVLTGLKTGDPELPPEYQMRLMQRIGQCRDVATAGLVLQDFGFNVSITINAWPKADSAIVKSIVDETRDEEGDDEEDEGDHPIKCYECDDPNCDGGSLCGAVHTREVYTVVYKLRNPGGKGPRALKHGTWMTLAESAEHAKSKFRNLKLAHGGVVMARPATAPERAAYFEENEDDG